MKITGLTSYKLRVPLGDKTFFSSQAAFPERNSYLLRIETDEGLVGWGEGGQYGPAEPVAACVDAVLAPKIIGRDPTEPVRIWEELYAFSRDFGQRGTYVEAMSAIDIALWDIAGQAAGVNIAKLLGGAFRDSIPSYATGCYYPQDFHDQSKLLDELRREASGYADLGFGLLKIKVGLLSHEADIERISVIRDEVGPSVGLMVDANHAYTAASAVRMGRLMEPFDIGFFEEPVPPEDRDGYRKVRAEQPLAVAGGECEFTRYGFRDFIVGGCADIVQPDLAVCGGFTAFRECLTLANCYNVATVPHVWGSGIAVAAALQAIAAIPSFPHTANAIPLVNEPVIEFDRKHNPLRDDLLAEEIKLVGGRLAVPTGPGLGVTVRDEIVAKYAI